MFNTLTVFHNGQSCVTLVCFGPAGAAVFCVVVNGYAERPAAPVKVELCAPP